MIVCFMRQETITAEQKYECGAFYSRLRPLPIGDFLAMRYLRVSDAG